MTLRLINDVFRIGKAGDLFTTRTDEQGQMYIDAGDAEQVADETESEKVLVLLNPEPGTYTTAYKYKDTGELVEGTDDVKTLSANLPHAKPEEQTEEVVETADPETGKTVKQKVKTGKK